MITSNKKKKPVAEAEKNKFEETRKQLNSFKPQTDSGKVLLKLSKKGLENGVGILNADEIMSELGRTYQK